MIDEVLDIQETIKSEGALDERIYDAPRPLVPIRRIIQFKISNERDNSKG